METAKMRVMVVALRPVQAIMSIVFIPAFLCNYGCFFFNRQLLSSFSRFLSAHFWKTSNIQTKSWLPVHFHWLRWLGW
jgi:hypothetical protein